MTLSRHHTLLSSVLFAALATLAGCGGEDGDDMMGPGLGTGSMSMTLDGQAWTAVAANVDNSNGIIVTAASNASGVAMGFAFLDNGPGTYTIGPGQVTNANHSTQGGNLWLASGSQGSGTLVVTTLTSTRVAGTFAFEMVAFAQETPPTRSITNGVFDIEF